MQATLSSTASGQQLRTGPFSGLPPSTQPRSLHECTPTKYSLPDEEGQRLRNGLPGGAVQGRAGVSSLGRNEIPVADGAGLAHDAGNLLGALQLYCDLLARPGVLRDEHRHYADELHLLSQRSESLVERLLNPAATGRRKVPVSDGTSVSVPLVVEQCRGLLNTITQRAVAVVYGAGSDAPVPVSQEAVERILFNLTRNAAEASASGGAITLRVHRMREQRNGRRAAAAHADNQSRNCIVLSVEDHGCGMSVAAAKVLLEGRTPTRRAADVDVRTEEQPQRLRELGLVSTKGLGRGLGLRVVRELVQASGGELRLKSQSGCGTTVEIAWAVAGSADAKDEGER